MIIIIPDKVKHVLTLGFVVYPMWIRRWLNKKWHDGHDYACKLGEKFKALVNGRVILKGQDKDGLFYVVTYLLTENNNVFFHVYRHFQKLDVQVGDHVVAGVTDLGEGGNLKHIHFGNYEATDPKKYQYG